MTSIVADVAKHYDDLDEYYRQLWGDHLHHGLWNHPANSIDAAVVNLIESLSDHLNIPTSGKICDVGCGYGATLRHLAKTRGWKGVGFTVSPRQHAYALNQSNSFSNLEYHCEDWLKNHLPPQSMDGVIAIESSEHMPDFGAFLTQVDRVLKPGGRFAIAAWLRDPAAPRLLDWALNDQIVREGRLAQMMPSDQFCQAIASRFRIIKLRDASKNVRLTWWHCAKKVALTFVQDASFRRRCLDAKFENRVFAITVFRILLAYYLGCMRYYLLVAEKPDGSHAGQ